MFPCYLLRKLFIFFCITLFFLLTLGVMKRRAIVLPGPASPSSSLGGVIPQGSGWLARFSFQVQRERQAFTGPLRSNHEDAESDRHIVASSIAHLKRSLRPDAAFRALERLRSASVNPDLGEVRRNGDSGWVARFSFQTKRNY